MTGRFSKLIPMLIILGALVGGSVLSYTWGATSTEIVNTGIWQLESGYQGIYVQTVADAYALDANDMLAIDRLSFICQDTNNRRLKNGDLDLAFAQAEMRYGFDPIKRTNLNRLRVLVDSARVEQNPHINVCNHRPIGEFATISRTAAPILLVVLAVAVAGYGVQQLVRVRKPEIEVGALPTPKFSITQVNFHLIIGGLLIAFLIAVAIFGPGLAPRDPMKGLNVWTAPDGKVYIPPIQPYVFDDFPLGSDHTGRDILSRLLWGVKPTLILAGAVAVTRLVVGFMMGFLGGWYEGKPAGQVVNNLMQIATTIPLIILAIVLLHIIELRDAGVWPFVIALNLTGWSKTAQFVDKRVRALRGEMYIEASRALGAGDFHIVLKHIVPDLRKLLVVMFSLEMGAVLLQLAELGFLGFFLGGGAASEAHVGAVGTLAGATSGVLPELGQLLSSGWNNFFIAPWTAVWTGTAFFVSVFSFMIFGEGLKRYYSEELGQKPIQRLLSAILQS